MSLGTVGTRGPPAPQTQRDKLPIANIGKALAHQDVVDKRCPWAFLICVVFIAVITSLLVVSGPSSAASSFLDHISRNF